jgi:hypothetical protein
LKNLFLVIVVTLVACSSPAPVIDQGLIDQLATEKAKAMVLQQQLDARNAALEPGEEGMPCKPNGSCHAGNSCDTANICRSNSSPSPEGSICASSIDCAWGLRCEVTGGRGTCQRPTPTTEKSFVHPNRNKILGSIKDKDVTSGNVGSACDADSDCKDGNKCDVREGKCYLPVGHLVIDAMKNMD